ncbi:aconitase family protein [Nocardioides sp. NPDC006273]|uniref:aconitase family protein n=1 Tax=Nocardioides sp. NPDC006273 TaxID=3155598 RepID=UPI0033A2B018
MPPQHLQDDVLGADPRRQLTGQLDAPDLRHREVDRLTCDRPGASFDVNPTSRQGLQDLMRMGSAFDRIAAGARLHQSGCLGCIGMGQALSRRGNSLRTMPRNFPGRSGTSDDSVFLCSPETAAASALTGTITDPRTLPDLLGLDYPTVELPTVSAVNTEKLEPPPAPDEAVQAELVKGPNIASLPDLEPLPDRLELPVLLTVGDDLSTDEILPAGARVLPYRSNIPKLGTTGRRPQIATNPRLEGLPVQQRGLRMSPRTLDVDAAREPFVAGQALGRGRPGRSG